MNHNKYYVQIDNYTTGFWDWITVYATNKQEAAIEASRILSESDQWRGYCISFISLAKEKNITCAPLDTNDIISLHHNQEDKDIYFDVNWANCTSDLARIAMDELWSNDTYPDNGILKNYLVHTYNKVKLDGSIIQTPEYALFNTGLFTKYYEPIYAYTTDGNFVSFLTEYELGGKGIEVYPDRANYFSQPELLLFDWHYKINVQYRHILESEENRQRIPQDILESGNVITILEGAINTMKKRVSSNYKLAIPQYFNGKIQLLLPLYLREDNVPDLALVVIKTGSYYQGHTCLTLDMAYNNARLIAKPESSWLT